MTFLRAAFLFVFLLTGCAATDRQCALALPSTNEVKAKKNDLFLGDLPAAISAARHSKYFPGTEHYTVGTMSAQQIDVLYYNARRTRVIVKRVHGRWKAVGQSVWQSCPLHHVRLQAKTMYRPPDDTQIHSLTLEGWAEAADRFPCATPDGLAKNRGELATIKTQVRYCPQCDDGLAQARKNLFSEHDSRSHRQQLHLDY